MKKIIASIALICGCSTSHAINSIAFQDFNYQILGNSTITGDAYVSAFLGTYSGGVFTPLSGSTGAFGLSGNSANDAFVNYDAINNDVLPVSTSVAIGIFDIADGALFSVVNASTKRAILTDTTWLAPTFDTAVAPFFISFTNSTTALVGTYSRSGVVETITLGTSVIPEPSTYAGLAGLAILGFAAMRRRRA